MNRRTRWLYFKKSYLIYYAYDKLLRHHKKFFIKLSYRWCKNIPIKLMIFGVSGLLKFGHLYPNTNTCTCLVGQFAGLFYFHLKLVVCQEINNEKILIRE